MLLLALVLSVGAGIAIYEVTAVVAGGSMKVWKFRHWLLWFLSAVVVGTLIEHFIHTP